MEPRRLGIARQVVAHQPLVHRIDGLGVGCRAFLVPPSDPREATEAPTSVTTVAPDFIQRGERLVL